MSKKEENPEKKIPLNPLTVIPQTQLPPAFISIRELCNDRARYATFPAFQRKQVWMLRQMQALIDTIFLGDPIPPFEGYQYYTEQGESIYGMIDGHQRISALLDFKDGKFKTWMEAAKRNAEPNSDPPLQPGKRFLDLDAIAKNCFLDYRLQINNVRKRSDKQITTRFLRIQNQAPLSAAERINAYKSKATDGARRIELSPFWEDFYFGETNREQILQSSLHLLALEMFEAKETLNLNSSTFIYGLAAGEWDEEVSEKTVDATLARLELVSHLYFGSHFTVRAAIIVMYQSVKMIERMGYTVQLKDKGKLTSWIEGVVAESNRASTVPHYNQPIQLMLSEKRQELFWKRHFPTVKALLGISDGLWTE